MAVRPVLRLPAPALKAVARPVDGAAEAATLAADLVDTMRAYDHCVGLAAPQIGVGLRAFCMDVTGHPKARSCAGLVVLFDPRVVEAGVPAVAREGCMSVPDLTGNVARPATVAVEARALLHELDHLDGVLFLDRVTSAATDLFRRRRYR
ncbi:MAG TPA: peptide deformylase [Actinomycetes bacterium]|nr:peptide deformylase [Actinomycetes bacterium]